MGLDSYLYARKYVPAFEWTNYKEVNPEYSALLSAVDGDRLTEEGSFTGASVDVPIMYWRKQNHIHRWFVENCQGGIDECQQAFVGRSQLVELRDLCQAVVDNAAKAPALLPTQSGFFFGGTEYDDWYMEGTRYTAERLTQLLDLLPDETFAWTFIYQSSW